jgi:hypothetical protein
LVYGVTMSHDDLSEGPGGGTGGASGWSSTPELNDALAGFAEEVRVGRPAGPITDEFLESLSSADQWELLVTLTRRELLRRAGHEPH